MKKLEVKSTKNYNKFKDILGNRFVIENHVKELLMSYSNEYLCTPIYVNEKMQVIDGQHRLKACAAMNLDVYYIIYDGWGIKQAKMLNMNNRSWKIYDYINMYARMGVQDYISLESVYKHYEEKFSYSTIINLMSKGRASHLREGGENGKVREGKFRMPKDSNYKVILETSEMFYQRFAFKSAYNRSFVKALSVILTRKDFSMNRLIKKVEDNKFMLEKRNDYYQYTKMLEDIYNRNARKKERFI